MQDSWFSVVALDSFHGLTHEGLATQAVEAGRMWDAEFAHPTSGKAMAPLDVTLIWMV